MNEDSFMHNSTTYRASSDGCTSCSHCDLFTEPMNCAVIERPFCRGDQRADGNNVVFKEMKK